MEVVNTLPRYMIHRLKLPQLKEKPHRGLGTGDVIVGNIVPSQLGCKSQHVLCAEEMNTSKQSVDRQKVCYGDNTNLIYCFAGAISSQFIVRRVEGQSRSVIQSYGCDQEGRRLSWETGVEKVGFKVFSE